MLFAKLPISRVARTCPTSSMAASAGAGGPNLTSIVVKWQGQELEISVDENDTVGCLKRKIQERTAVQQKRQKLLGLKVKGPGKRTIEDDVAVATLDLRPGQKIMLMGTKEEDIVSTLKQQEAAPEVQDDFDIAEGDLQEVDVRDKEENQEKLRRWVAAVDVQLLNPPRPGKKCLVLDIDYTLFDLGSSAERAEELARPHLHQFLAGVSITER